MDLIRYLVAFALPLTPLAAQTPPASPISADRIKENVRVLSSDEFLGRGPGEAGEEKTLAYLADQFGKAGLEPAGENGEWFQDVPLVRLDRQPGATMTLNVAGKAFSSCLVVTRRSRCAIPITLPSRTRRCLRRVGRGRSRTRLECL